MLVQDFVNMALQALGVVSAAGRLASASEQTRGLTVFQNMVDTSNTSRAMIFCEVINQFPTVANQQTYSWGMGGTWDALRPAKITQANLLLPTSPVIRRHMAVWSRQQWASIVLQDIYTYPEGLYCDYADWGLDDTPNAANIYLAPIPASAYTIETYSWQANALPTASTQSIAFPPGYQEYWLYGLALRLQPMHKDRCPEVPAAVLDGYKRASLGIARLNAAASCPRLGTDPALGGIHGSWYNYLTGLTEA